MFARFYAFAIVIIAYNDDTVAALLIKFNVSNLMNFFQDGNF